MFIFYSLWRAIYAGRPLFAGFTMTQALWYLTFTEAIELSKSRTYVQIQQEVKDGTIAYSLIRPYSYIMYHFSKTMGENIVKVVPMLLEGFLLAFLFTGMLPGYFTHLPYGLLLILGGFVLVTLWQILIGLLAFWFEEVAPFYWILQKLIFVIGGMFFPIDMFPQWLQGISKASPFAFSAYWPAIVMVKFEPRSFMTALIGQCVYIAVLMVACSMLFATAKRKVHAQGG